MTTAIETTATIEKERQLLLDEDLPENVAKKVRAVVLFDETVRNERLPDQRKRGSAKGLIKMSEDFDESLEDFKDYQP